MNNKALPATAILAGGLATRLKPLGLKVPKALVPVAGKPFLVHVIDMLRGQGVSRLVICVGHLGEQIVETIGSGRALGVSVDYSFDGDRLLGTAGTIKKAAVMLGDEFFVLNGDTYLNSDFQNAHTAFVTSGKPGLMCVFRNQNRSEPSNVAFSGGRMLSYDKANRSTDMEHVDCGLGLLHRAVLDRIPDREPYDLARLYQVLLRDGELAGHEVIDPYYEVGSPEGLVRTERFFSARQMPVTSEHSARQSSAPKKNQLGAA